MAALVHTQSKSAIKYQCTPMCTPPECDAIKSMSIQTQKHRLGRDQMIGGLRHGCGAEPSD